MRHDLHRLVPLIAMVLTFAGPTRAGSAGQGGEPIVGVARAYDGDGIYAGNVKIRLWGIDAAELGTVEGKAAFVSLALFDGQLVKCTPPPASRTIPVSFDRLVALCTISETGEDLARYQVMNDVARDWPKFSKGYYAR